MWIEQLHIQSCRVIDDLTLQFSPYINILLGENGSGKSSILEALSLISKGRSFRTAHISNVIQYHQEKVLVAAKTCLNHLENEQSKQIGVEKTRQKTRIRINQQDIHSQAELSRHIPITVIHPDSVELITGSPALRRAYLDWIAFYCFPDFHEKWKQYSRVLKQRNHCLKDPQYQSGLDQWTAELIQLQPIIHDYRLQALEIVIAPLKEISPILLNDFTIELELKSGFPADIDINVDSLEDYYQEKRDADIKRGRTSAGMHRADLKILFDNVAADECASRGQLKLLAICLLLAQSNTIENHHQMNGIILIDDLTAELDKNNKKKLMDYLQTLDKQIIITATHNDVIQTFDIDEGHTIKMFHVEHGNVSELNQ